MTHTLGRKSTTPLPAALALALAGSALSGCGLLDGGSRIEEALGYLPSDATRITFVDRAAAAERLDIDDIETGAGEADLDRWRERSLGEGYGTQLVPYALAMQEAAFSDFDVEWEVTAIDDGLPDRVWKLDEDADFDAIADDLTDAGYERTGDDDTPVFSVELSQADGALLGDRYPLPMLLELALVPDEHLVVAGDVDSILAAALDDADSLSDEGAFDDLLDVGEDLDELEYASLDLDASCEGRRPTSPAFEELAGELGVPEAIAVFVPAEEDVVVARLFDDPDAAESDTEGLRELLPANVAATGLEVDFDVETDGDAVLVSAPFEDRGRVIAAEARLDGPFLCGAS